MPEPDLGASPRALRAAGLTRDPFAEPGLWPEGEGYLDDARSQILAQLGAPDAYGAPAVLLLGLQGMGKTALLAGALSACRTDGVIWPSARPALKQNP